MAEMWGNRIYWAKKIIGLYNFNLNQGHGLQNTENTSYDCSYEQQVELELPNVIRNAQESVMKTKTWLRNTVGFVVRAYIVS